RLVRRLRRASLEEEENVAGVPGPEHAARRVQRATLRAAAVARGIDADQELQPGVGRRQHRPDGEALRRGVGLVDQEIAAAVLRALRVGEPGRVAAAQAEVAEVVAQALSAPLVARGGAVALAQAQRRLADDVADL